MVSMSAAETNEIVGELYQVPPARFTAARDELVRKARAAGDRKLARELQGLRRPTQSAWLVNVLTRQERALMDQLVAVGRELRDAQVRLDGQRLRRLSVQRQQLVADLVERARLRAADAGLRPTEDALSEVRATLEAALVDLAASSTVLAGRLVRPMSHVGFGPMPQVTPPPRVTAPAEPAATPPSAPPATAEERSEPADAGEAGEAAAVAEPGWRFWPIEPGEPGEDATARPPEHPGAAPSPPPALAPVPSPSAEERQQTARTERATPEDGVRRAEAALAAAESTHWQREHELADAQGALDAARDRLEWLDRQRMEARREKATAERRVAEARSAQRAAIRAAAEARRALEAAERKRSATGE
jgi:hypothetical protein